MKKIVPSGNASTMPWENIRPIPVCKKYWTLGVINYLSTWISRMLKMPSETRFIRSGSFLLKRPQSAKDAFTRILATLLLGAKQMLHVQTSKHLIGGRWRRRPVPHNHAYILATQGRLHLYPHLIHTCSKNLIGFVLWYPSGLIVQWCLLGLKRLWVVD